MATEARLVVGFCSGCKAIRYRTEWLGPVRCEHKPGCLVVKRERHLERQLHHDGDEPDAA